MNPANWLTLQRSVRFSDTDAAGVVHFQALLGWAHQAWEESLERYGLAAGTIFPGGREGMPGIALPIVHCDADSEPRCRWEMWCRSSLSPNAWIEGASRW